MKIAHRFGQVREIYRPFFGRFALHLSIILSIQIVSLVSPYVYGRVVDGLIRNKPLRYLVMCAVAMLVITFISNMLSWWRDRSHINHIAFDVEDRLDEITLSKVLRFSIGQITNQNSGFKQDVIRKGQTAIIEMVEMLLFETIPCLFQVTVIIIALFWLNFWIGLVVSSSAAILCGMSIWINLRMLPEAKRHNKLSNKLGTAYWELIKHLRLVMVCNQEERAVTEYASQYRHFSDWGKCLWTSYVNKVAFLRQPFAILGQFGTLLVGIFLVRSGKVTSGNLVAVLGWSMGAFGALGTIGNMQRRIMKYAVLTSRYFDLLDMAPAITLAKNPIRPANFCGQIEFRSVSFKYPEFTGDMKDEWGEVRTKQVSGSGPAIKNISVTIPMGKITALVGHSGSGKSTFVNLLLRGYDPDEGQILIDGHDLRLLDYHLWRKSVGMVEQDPKLWDNTLAYNMAYGLSGSTDLMTEKELEHLAAKTRIDEFYHRLGSTRFETQIGENGVQLSGGQRQRVAIARAIAKSPSVLILDEATNALDPHNERLVHGAIRDALRGRTGIIIAHRLSTIRHSDQIIVFEKGTVVGAGRHEDLVETCEAYQNLVMSEVGSLV